jgi:hypothetical protein
MAKIPSGILGKISGKVGNVVGASWKGIAYIRAYVIPANPDTESQKAERGLFADLVALGHACLGSVIQPFWDPFLRGISGWSKFVGVNRKLYTAEDDYSPVKLATGTREGAVIAAAVYTSPNVAVSWDETVLGNGALTDDACVFIYDEVNKVGFFSSAVTRDDEASVINVGAGRAAANLNAWLFFVDDKDAPLSVSDSDHAQVTAP